ncbi:MAG TPA: ferrochelatase [Candidatus Angelobacter sp.]|jgi:ferrochelatase|nr:ferrochelatase [Candidatus Angelobacter sp.]
MNSFDALLVVSFGGPEKHEDVLPFLDNVLRGRNVPRERMLEVAEHYYHFDGHSPINKQNLDLIAALGREFQAHKLNLRVYWGNRNWHPFVSDTLKQMHADGVRRAAALATSAFGSYSGCRQYRENIAQGLQSTGVDDMVVEKLPNFYDRPEFLEVMTERVRDALAKLPDAQQVVFTAHSVPVSMAQNSPYVRQLETASEHVAAACGMRHWALVFQSRSGPPTQRWLEPDINDHLRMQHGAGVQRVIVCPIGFMSDHMEVLYDLDTQLREMCEAMGMKMVRAGTAGSHPKIVSMIRDLVINSETTPVNAYCEPGCCPTPQRPGR